MIKIHQTSLPNVEANEVCSMEYALYFKMYGIVQNSSYYWAYNSKNNLFRELRIKSRMSLQIDASMNEEVAAFSYRELLFILFAARLELKRIGFDIPKYENKITANSLAGELQATLDKKEHLAVQEDLLKVINESLKL